MTWEDIIRKEDSPILDKTSSKQKKRLKKILQSTQPTEYMGQDFTKLGDLLDELKGIDFIVDDTEDNISAKIKKFNLIGIPYQIILGNKTPDDAVEFREVGGESKIIKLEDIEKIAKNISDNRN